MRESELRDLLERATDRIDAGDLAEAALAGTTAAHRRRRVYAAGVAAASVLVVVLAGLTLGGGGDQDPSPAPSPTPPTSSPSSSTDAELDALLALPTPPSVDPAVIQPMWDPEAVADLPGVDIGLPADLTPPDSPPALTSIPAALAVVDDEQQLFVLDAAGAWSRLAYPEQALPAEFASPASALSRDGTRIVFTGRSTLWSRDVRGGDWREVSYPDGFLALEGWQVHLEPQVAEMLRLGRKSRSWAIDLDTGTVEELGVDLGNTAWGGGDVTVRIQFTGKPYDMRVISWGIPGGPERSWRTNALHSLTGPAADQQSLAAVRGVGSYGEPREPFERNGLIALDLDDLSTRAYLPIVDPNYSYTDGGAMAVRGWLDADTVLVEVLLGGAETGIRHLFVWNVETGDLSRASQLPADLDVALASWIFASP